MMVVLGADALPHYKYFYSYRFGSFGDFFRCCCHWNVAFVVAAVAAVVVEGFYCYCLCDEIRGN